MKKIVLLTVLSLAFVACRESDPVGTVDTEDMIETRKDQVEDAADAAQESTEREAEAKKEAIEAEKEAIQSDLEAQDPK